MTHAGVEVSILLLADHSSHQRTDIHHARHEGLDQQMHSVVLGVNAQRIDLVRLGLLHGIGVRTVVDSRVRAGSEHGLRGIGQFLGGLAALGGSDEVAGIGKCLSQRTGLARASSKLDLFDLLGARVDDALLDALISQRLTDGAGQGLCAGVLGGQGDGSSRAFARAFQVEGGCRTASADTHGDDGLCAASDGLCNGIGGQCIAEHVRVVLIGGHLNSGAERAEVCAEQNSSHAVHSTSGCTSALLADVIVRTGADFLLAGNIGISHIS